MAHLQFQSGKVGQGIPRASKLAQLTISVSSGFDWGTLPQWIKWKNGWCWFLTLTSDLHIHVHICAHTQAKHTYTQTCTLPHTRDKWKIDEDEWIHPECSPQSLCHEDHSSLENSMCSRHPTVVPGSGHRTCCPELLNCHCRFLRSSDVWQPLFYRDRCSCSTQSQG